MVFARYTRLALVGSALLLSLIGRAESASSFQFSDCVEGCIVSSGCATNSAKCMCKSARALLLDSVISCMFFNCKSELRDFENAFLDPIEGGCEDSDRAIPESKLQAAESLASSYISKLPPLTTAKSPSSSAAATPKPTTAPRTATAESAASSTFSRASRASTPEQSSQSSTSTVDRGVQTEPASTTQIVTSATQVAAPPPATETSATPSESAASEPGNFDTNPFSTSNSAGVRTQAFLSLLGLPMAAAVMLALR
ncbi:hypothetical protein VTK56DRAFT_8707 [Thermocarpiscus australiensis]